MNMTLEQRPQEVKERYREISRGKSRPCKLFGLGKNTFFEVLDVFIKILVLMIKRMDILRHTVSN